MVQFDMITLCLFLFCCQYQFFFVFIILGYYALTTSSPFPAFLTESCYVLLECKEVCNILHNVTSRFRGVLFIDSTILNCRYQWLHIGTNYMKENLMHFIKVCTRIVLFLNWMVFQLCKVTQASMCSQQQVDSAVVGHVPHQWPRVCPEYWYIHNVLVVLKFFHDPVWYLIWDDKVCSHPSLLGFFISSHKVEMQGTGLWHMKFSHLCLTHPCCHEHDTHSQSTFVGWPDFYIFLIHHTIFTWCVW